MTGNHKEHGTGRHSRGSYDDDDDYLLKTDVREEDETGSSLLITDSHIERSFTHRLGDMGIFRNVFKQTEIDVTTCTHITKYDRSKPVGPVSVCTYLKFSVAL